jgi:hypothetical protein
MTFAALIVVFVVVTDTSGGSKNDFADFEFSV